MRLYELPVSLCTLQELKANNREKIANTTRAKLLSVIKNTRKWLTKCMDTGESHLPDFQS